MRARLFVALVLGVVLMAPTSSAAAERRGGRGPQHGAQSFPAPIAAKLETAIAAGADFAVAPGTNPEIVRASLERGLPILPGVSTPSEVETAMALGLRTVKLFPAELLGGAPYVRALCGPYRDIGFVPTGSITPETLPGYLEITQVLACGGSWMVRPAVIAAGDFATIEQLASDAVRLVGASR